MKVKIGTDILEIDKFRKSLKKTNFLENTFSPFELKNSDVQHLAGLFAAKEAVIKALGFKPGSWLDIEIENQKSGAPYVNLPNKIKKKILDSDMSISHDGKYVLATFVVLLNDSRKS